MVKKVLKFGGTSVGSIDRIQHVAGIIKREFEAGNQVIAIVSAMSGKTNDLINLSKNISENFDKRELDVLLSTGEQVSSSLLAGALINSDVKARTWLNWQIPILTEGEHSNSRIIIPSKEIIDFKEAIIFAYLGILRIEKINNCLSSVTGAKYDNCGGDIYTK